MRHQRYVQIQTATHRSENRRIVLAAKIAGPVKIEGIPGIALDVVRLERNRPRILHFYGTERQYRLLVFRQHVAIHVKTVTGRIARYLQSCGSVDVAPYGGVVVEGDIIHLDGSGGCDKCTGSVRSRSRKAHFLGNREGAGGACIQRAAILHDHFAR